MFGLAVNLWNYMKKKGEKKVTLVLVGLDGAGKTTLVNTLKGVNTSTTVTWGFNNETYKEGNMTMDIYDLGGGKTIRKIWERYYAEIHGAVYVIDAAEKTRSEEAKEALHEMLRSPFLSGKPILIFANKQDLTTAMTAPEVAQALGLSSLQNNRHQIIPCTAKMAEGATDGDPAVKKGLKWLQQSIESEFSKLSVRVEKDAAEQRAKEEKAKEERRIRVEKQRAERKREQEAEERRKQEGGEAEPSGSSNGENGTIGPGGVNEHTLPKPEETKSEVYNDGLLNSVTLPPHLAVNGKSKEGVSSLPPVGPPLQPMPSLGVPVGGALRPMGSGGGSALLEPIKKEGSSHNLHADMSSLRDSTSTMVPGGVASPAIPTKV